MQRHKNKAIQKKYIGKTIMAHKPIEHTLHRLICFSLSPLTYHPRRDKKFPDSATHHQGITFL